MVVARGKNVSQLSVGDRVGVQVISLSPNHLSRLVLLEV